MNENGLWGTLKRHMSYTILRIVEYKGGYARITDANITLVDLFVECAISCMNIEEEKKEIKKKKEKIEKKEKNWFAYTSKQLGLREWNDFRSRACLSLYYCN